MTIKSVPWSFLYIYDNQSYFSLSDTLDIDQAPSETFAIDEKGRLNSLTTVLTQEVERYNRLLSLIKVGFEYLAFRKPFLGLVIFVKLTIMSVSLYDSWNNIPH